MAQVAAERWAQALPALPRAGTPDEAVAEAAVALNHLGFTAVATGPGDTISITVCPYAAARRQQSGDLRDPRGPPEPPARADGSARLPGVPRRVDPAGRLRGAPRPTRSHHRSRRHFDRKREVLVTTTETTSTATADFLVKAGRFFTPGTVSADLRTVTREGGREGDVFYRDRWSHDKVVRSTHGVNCTGQCSWKVYVKDGIITWETQQTDYPSVGPDSPEYEPRGCPRGRGVLLVHVLPHPCALPLRSRCPPRGVPQGTQAARRPGRRLGIRRRRPRHPPALPARARQGRPRACLVGGGQRDHCRRPRAHHQGARARSRLRLLAHPRHVDGLARRRCALHQPHGRLDAVLLRLVRRPAGRVAAGLRRPDRRARVRRLVERGVPDHVGLQRPRHAHARRALHGRGPVPRPEGRHGLARLRRQHQVRRRVDGSASRHRRRPRDGHGPRDPQGVLHRAPGAALRRLRQEVQRPAVPRVAAGEGRRLGAGQVRHVGRPGQTRPRAPRSRPCSSTRPPGGRTCPTARSASASTSPAWASGTSTSRAWIRPSRCTARRARRASRSSCRASTWARPRTRAAASTTGASPRRDWARRTASAWSPPSSTCCSRSTASAAMASRASGPPATTTPSPTRPRGRRRSPACRPRWPSASAASSRRTPRTPAVAR